MKLWINSLWVSNLRQVWMGADIGRRYVYRWSQDVQWLPPQSGTQTSPFCPPSGSDPQCPAGPQIAHEAPGFPWLLPWFQLQTQQKGWLLCSVPAAALDIVALPKTSLLHYLL